jgi:leucyl/phenylalanyl-tRNA--protein transferase
MPAKDHPPPPVRTLTPGMLLQAYAAGIFPMAEQRDSADIHWIDPLRRGVIPLDRFHISRSLRRRMVRGQYQLRFDHDFAATVMACADRPETWINETIHDLYLDLHRMGHAHSAEIWDGPDLIGGVFGISLNAAFFGESMFSRRTDTSKMALAYLVQRLRAGGFVLFDTQFITPHLASLGAVEIPRATYRDLLRQALLKHADFNAQGLGSSPFDVVTQRNSQTS